MKIQKYLLEKFLNFIGDIQFYKLPMFIVFGQTHYKIKGPQQRAILNILKRGDILIRKYDHYFSTVMIPGYWDHSAIYIGGNSVLQATRKGIAKEDILTFLRTDHVIVFRAPEKIRKQAVPIAVRKAKKSIGKGYDYEFKTDDHKEFYCTEFTYYCYSDFPELEMKPRESGFTKGRILADDYCKFKFDVVYNSLEHDKYI